MTLERLFKMSVIFIASVIAVMILLSIVASALIFWGGDSGPSEVRGQPVPPVHAPKQPPGR